MVSPVRRDFFRARPLQRSVPAHVRTTPVLSPRPLPDIWQFELAQHAGSGREDYRDVGLARRDLWRFCLRSRQHRLLVTLAGCARGFSALLPAAAVGASLLQGAFTVL